jgi:iron complex transport system substrate-binding protein
LISAGPGRRALRIASLLPSATEILWALDLLGDVVALTHECDYPPEARRIPAVVRPRLDQHLGSREIDARVSEAAGRGESLYAIDEDLLASVRPEMVITQDLCDVCALPGTDVDRVLERLPGRPQVLRLHPHTLEDILRDILTVGEATGRAAQARRVVAGLRARIARVEDAVRGRRRQRVVCVEWLDPPYCSGHWMPELVERAGGREVLGRPGRPSVRIRWEDVLRAEPEVLVLAVCGFDVPRTAEDVSRLWGNPAWRQLVGKGGGQVYATDAGSFFSRSGPRIVDGLEILGALLHPEAATWPTPPGSWARLVPQEPLRLR